MVKRILVLLLAASCAYSAGVPFIMGDKKLQINFEDIYNRIGKLEGGASSKETSNNDFVKRLVFGDIQCNSLTAESFISLVAGLRITRDATGNAVFDVTGDYAIFKDTIKIQDATAIVMDPTLTGVYSSTISASSDGLVYDAYSSHQFKDKVIFDGYIESRGDMSVNGNLTVYDSMTVTGDVYISSHLYVQKAITISSDPISTQGTLHYGGGFLEVLDDERWRVLNPARDVSEPNGFTSEAVANTTLSFVAGTGVFTISGSSFTIYVDGSRLIKSTESVTIDAVKGLWYIYYSSNGVLTASQTEWPWKGTGKVATVYTTGTDALLGYERHGISMDWATHQYLHNTVGVRYVDGLTLTAGNTWFAMTSGTIQDEDNILPIPSTNTCTVLSHNETIGSGMYGWLASTSQYIYTQGGNVYYDNLTIATPADANKYVAIWLFGTNDKINSIYALLGQRQDTLLADARTNNKYESLSLSNLPLKEMKLLYRVIVRNDATPFEEIQDLRSVSNLPGGTYVATDHGILTGLGDDDHAQYAFTDGSRDITGNQTFESSATVLGDFGVAGKISRPATFTSSVTLSGVNLGVSGEITMPMTYLSSATFKAVTLAKSNIYMADDTGIGLGPTSGLIKFDDQTQDEVIVTGARLGINSETPESIMSYTSGAMGSYFYMNMVPGSYNAVGFIPYKDSGHYINAAYTNSAGSFLVDSSTGDFIFANYDYQNTNTCDILFGTGNPDYPGTGAGSGGPVTVMKVLGRASGVEIVGTKYLGVGGNIVSSNTAGVNKFYGQVDIVGTKNLGVGGVIVSSGTQGSNRFAGQIDAKMNVGVGGVLISSSTTGTSTFAKNVSVTGLLSGSNIVSSNTASVAGMLSGGNIISSGTLNVTGTSTFIGTTTFKDDVIIKNTLVISTSVDPVAGDYLTFDVGSDGSAMYFNAHGGGEDFAFQTLGGGDSDMTFDISNSNSNQGDIKFDLGDPAYSTIVVEDNRKLLVSTIATSGSNLYIQSPINFESDAIRLSPAGQYQYTSTITFLSENLVIDPYDDLIIKGTSLVNYGNLETLTNLSAGGVIYSSGSGTNQFTGPIDGNSSLTIGSITATAGQYSGFVLSNNSMYVSPSTYTHMQSRITTSYFTLPGGSHISTGTAYNTPFCDNYKNYVYSVNDSSYNYVPAIQRLHDGRMFMVYKKGTAHAPEVADIYGCWSSDGGVTWTGHNVILNGNDDTKVYSGAHIKVLRSGRIVLSFHFITDFLQPDSVATMYSDNDGVTWTSPIYSVDDTYDKIGTAGAIEELQNGEWYLPWYAYNDGDTYLAAFGAYSSNNGTSWTKVTIASDMANVEYGETDIIQLRNGTLYALIHSDTNSQYPKVYASTSTDNGRTWGTPWFVFNGDNHPTMIEDSFGRLVSVYRRSSTVAPTLNYGSAYPCIRVTNESLSWSTTEYFYDINYQDASQGAEQGAEIIEMSEGLYLVAYSVSESSWQAYIATKYLVDGGNITPTGAIAGRGITSMDGDIKVILGDIILTSTITNGIANIKISSAGFRVYNQDAMLSLAAGEPVAGVQLRSIYGLAFGITPETQTRWLMESYDSSALQMVVYNTQSEYIFFGDNNDADIGLIHYDHSADKMSLRANNLNAISIYGTRNTDCLGSLGVAGAIYSTGTVYIGDNSNANVTLGLTINQGANDDSCLELKSSDVGVPFTTYTEADTYLRMDKYEAAGGGARIRGMSDTNNTGLRLDGWYGSKTVTTYPIEIIGRKTDGATALVACSSTEPVVGVYSHTTLLGKINGNGDWISTGAHTAGSKTAAQLRVYTPINLGEMWFNSTDAKMYYSTGTAQGAFASFDAYTAP